MAQSNLKHNQKQPAQNQQPASLDLSPELIKQFLDNQSQRLVNDAHEFKLREKELELSAQQADKALDYQARFHQNLPGENRKTIAYMGAIAIIIILSILGAITFWIHLGKEEFANKFLGLIGYLVTTILGFWGGRVSKRGSKTTITEPAETTPVEVVEDGR